MSDGGDPIADSSPGYVNVPTFLWNYAYDHSDLAQAASELHHYMQELADEASIPVHAIESRAKKLESYRDKCLKLEPDGTPKYTDPARQIYDCVAARIILFTTGARNDLGSIIEAHTEVLEHRNPGDTKHNGYDSEHYIITALKDRDVRARHPALARYLDKYPGLEIQLRSVAAHAWAEYEHDIRYKSGAYEQLSDNDRAQIDQWFIEAGGMRRVMDDLFDKIQKLLHSPTEIDAPPIDPADLTADLSDEDEANQDPRILDPGTLAEFIQERFPRAEVGDQAAVADLVEHLQRLSITTVNQLETSLAEIDVGQVARLMDYPTEPSGARQLDDELLAAFTERYVDTSPDEGRAQLLQLRLRRVRGRFAIYSIDNGRTEGRPVTAAHAVRDLATMVANEYGIQSVLIENAIALSRDGLQPSAAPRVVRTIKGRLYVATNLSRSSAESIMRELVERAPGSNIRVRRAGDVIYEAEPRAYTKPED